MNPSVCLLYPISIKYISDLSFIAIISQLKGKECNQIVWYTGNRKNICTDAVKKLSQPTQLVLACSCLCVDSVCKESQSLLVVWDMMDITIEVHKESRLTFFTTGWGVFHPCEVAESILLTQRFYLKFSQLPIVLLNILQVLPVSASGSHQSACSFSSV